MLVKIIGNNLGVGDSLNSYTEEHLIKVVKKYFDRAISAEVHFVKSGHLFKVLILVNEGVRGGIKLKSDAEGGDPYAAVNEACDKIARQLARYKDKLKHYRGDSADGVVSELEMIDATKHVLLPNPMEGDHSSSINIIEKKSTELEELTVQEAIMKMDLADLPTLVFLNKQNKKMNVIYYRKDGNISWIDPR